MDFKVRFGAFDIPPEQHQVERICQPNCFQNTVDLLPGGHAGHRGAAAIAGGRPQQGDIVRPLIGAQHSRIGQHLVVELQALVGQHLQGLTAFELLWPCRRSLLQIFLVAVLGFLVLSEKLTGLNWV